jgi:signal peptidase I
VTSSNPQSRAAEARRGESKGGVLRELVLIVGVALVLSVLVRTFVAQAFFVPSSSMEDTLLVQDRILVSKLSTTFGDVQRGEIVVFTDPSDWLPEPAAVGGVRGTLRTALTWVGLLPSDTGEDLVKRVIGIGGDHIVCCDAQERIVLNGVSLDEPYLKPGGGTAQVRFDVVVPPGRIFVMGDNRDDSADSRFHLEEQQGTVPDGNVVGRVVAVIWPVSRWSGEPIPSIFENPAISEQKAVKPGASTGSTPSEEAQPEPGTE